MFANNLQIHFQQPKDVGNRVFVTLASLPIFPAFSELKNTTVLNLLPKSMTTSIQTKQATIIRHFLLDINNLICQPIFSVSLH